MNWIIEKAKEIYKKYGSGNLDFVVDKLGAKLLELPLTKRIKEVYFHDLKTIVIDPSLHPYQKRHLICHALAHYLFHRGKKVNYFIDGNKNFIEGIKVRKMEREAETFAAHFLIPEEKLNPILKEEWLNDSPEPISELAEEFQVTEELMKKRLEFENLLKQ